MIIFHTKKHNSQKNIFSLKFKLNQERFGVQSDRGWCFRPAFLSED